ncbi:MAG: 50S ribosomal protein L19e, partial [Nanoarchaeota archaeon]
KKKGRRKGIGSRKGATKARFPAKRAWIIKIRNQKKILKELRDKNLILRKDYRMLYKKAKGGFFRSKRHIEIYIDEHKLMKHGK